MPKELINSPRIYLDFESNTRGDIYLLGYQLGDVFHQTITTASLKGLANHHQFSLRDPLAATKELLNTALELGASIVAYSEAEKNIFKRLSKMTDMTNFANVPYINLAKAAKTWVNRFKRAEFSRLGPFRRGVDRYRERTMRRSLASIMRLTDYTAPSDYAPGKTTARLNTVCDALNRRNKIYDSLTAVQKAKATKVLKHNEFDVKALDVLLKTIQSTDISCFNKSITTCL